jgi:hypothetical protein
MTIILAAILGIAIGLPMIFFFESWLNEGDEFLEVEEWHNFQTKMRNKK